MTAPAPQFYDATDTTLQVTGIAISLEVGTSNGPTTYHLWNDKGGGLNAGTLSNLRIQPMVNDGVNEVFAGFPILDEKWIKVAVSGKNNTGDSTMEDQTTGFVPVGAGAPLILKNIPKNCARFLDIKIEAPAGASALTQPTFLKCIFDEASIVIPLRLSTISSQGVIPDRLDASARRLRRGRGLTAAGTADVTIVKGSFVYDGSVTNVLQSTKTLNQNDGAGQALTAGQSYIAVLSQKSDGTVTATKGNRGAAPTAPNVPAGEIFLGKVTVNYQAGGVSIINTGNLDMTGVTYGEYLVTAGTGLTAKIGAGFAITTTDNQPFGGSTSFLGLTDNATNRVWVRPDGTFSATTTSTPPVIGAFLLATVVTAAGAITTITDVRLWVDHSINEYLITLRKSGNITATANDYAYDFAPFDYVIDRVVLEIGQKGTSTSGSFKADVLTRPQGTDMSTAGTTIYTSSGTDDQRVSVAYNAANLHAEGIDHEIVSGSKGDRISASIVAVPGGITVNPQDFTVQVVLRRK